MTKNEALDLVALLIAHYPAQAKLAPENVKAFVAHLTCYPAELGAKAVERVVRSSRLFPNVAEVVTEIVELALGLPSPESAWMLVLERARADDWQNPAKPVPATVLAALRAAGGSYALRNTATHLVRKAFLESYTAARKDLADRLREVDLPEIERARRTQLTEAPPASAADVARAAEAAAKAVS